MSDRGRAEFLLAGEVVIKGTLGNSNAIEDVLKAHAMETMFCEHHDTLVEQFFPGEMFRGVFHHRDMIRPVVSIMQALFCLPNKLKRVATK